MKRTVTIASALLVSLLCAVVLFVFIDRAAVAVPFADELKFGGLYEELAKGDLPILPQAEHELFDRARRAEGDDPARLAARLGLTKAAAKKRLEEPAH